MPGQQRQTSPPRKANSTFLLKKRKFFPAPTETQLTATGDLSQERFKNLARKGILEEFTYQHEPGEDQKPINILVGTSP
jgi:hypothetical protein